MNVELKGKMVEELSKKYLDLLQRLNMRVNDDINDDLDVDPMQLFHTHTSDGILIRKLFVANLAERTTYRDLNNLFSKYGKVDSCYLKRNANRSNYAFVTFNDAHDALKARWDGYKKEIRLHNRDLRVFSADSWHQPDSIECQNKLAQLKSKGTSEDSISWETDETEEEPSLIDKLNDDCLMHIFQFLPIVDRVQIERVCKRWRTVSLNSWHSCRRLSVASIFQGCPSSIDTPSVRKVLLRCGQFLTDISCSGNFFDLSQSTLTIITKLCPNIQKLDINGITVTPAGISSVISTYLNLTEFKLGVCSYCCDSDLKKVFQNNSKLKKFHVTNNQINGSCLVSLPETVEELSLCHCNDLLSNHFCDAIQRLTKLKSLTMVHCIRMFDSTIEKLSMCEEINRLVLTGAFPLLSQDGMNNIARMTNLKELSVEECNPNLVTDTFLSEIIVLSKLTKLNITKCEKVTDEGVSKLFSLPNLEHLEMGFLAITEFCIDKSNTPLKLKTLNCKVCCKLTDKSICSVIESAPCLELLVLDYCYRLTNQVLEVATQCTKKRTNDILLKLEAHDTDLTASMVNEISPLLHVVNYRRNYERQSAKDHYYKNVDDESEWSDDNDFEPFGAF